MLVVPDNLEKFRYAYCFEYSLYEQDESEIYEDCEIFISGEKKSHCFFTEKKSLCYRGGISDLYLAM